MVGGSGETESGAVDRGMVGVGGSDERGEKEDDEERGTDLGRSFGSKADPDRKAAIMTCGNSCCVHPIVVGKNRVGI